MPTSVGTQKVLARKLKKPIKGIEWKSGRFYKFKYKAWTNDKHPHIIFMYAFQGYHPTTGREWRFFQAINFSYIPRTRRRIFLQQWIDQVKREPNLIFTWDIVKRKWPWLKIALRRYFYSPADYIIKPEEIPLDNAEEMIMGTWAKDFSKKIVMQLRSKFRKTKKGKKAHKKKKVISEKRYKAPRYWTHKDTDRQHGL